MGRFKDWVVSVVQHGVQSKDTTIQSLKSELKSLQRLTQHQEGRLSEMEGEVKAHSTAGRMVKSELDSWYTHAAILIQSYMYLADAYYYAVVMLTIATCNNKINYHTHT